MHHWVKFKDVSSDRLGVIVNYPGYRIKAEQERDEIVIPFSDRAAVTLYPHFKPYKRIIKLTFPYDKLKHVNEWLIGSGRLEITTDPFVYFRATVLNSVSHNMYELGLFQYEVEFLVDPFAFLLAGDEEITVKQDMTLINQGNWFAKPIYKILSGSGAGIISVNGKTMSLSNIVPGIAIDTDLMTAYLDQINVGERMTGEFLQLQPGENKILFSGGITGLSIIPRWCER